MSLNSDLQTLKTNIEGVKSTLYTNLTNKGVTDITESDTLTTLANKVSTITAGGSGFDFSQIGYSDELNLELNDKMNADIAYSKTLYDAWNPSNTSASRLYKKDTKIVYAPNINTINVTSMDSMFSGCTSLHTVPKFYTKNVTNMSRMFCNCFSLNSVPELDTSNVTSMENMFYGCSSLKTIPAFNTKNVTNIGYLFYNCNSLTSIPELDTSQVTVIQYMFYNCTNLKTIEGISFKSYSASTVDSRYLFGPISNDSIRKAVFKDIGYQSTTVQFEMTKITNWGVNSDEILDARQSLIDSLITYSFDRASAGYPTCNITLSDNTKALLTSDEISQINAKGFTIA